MRRRTSRVRPAGESSARIARGIRPTPFEGFCILAGLLLTLRYAWLMDDAFVYYRYVDNAVFAHLGLVYNIGEYVEGFSSPLWTLLLLCLRVVGIGYWTITRGLGLLACAVVGWGLVIANRRLSPHGGGVVNPALCLLMFNYGALCSFTSGLETPLVQVAGVLYALWAVRPGTRWIEATLAFTPLVRHELLLPLAIVWGATWLRQRRLPLWLTAWSVAVNGAWLVFRVIYYADLLPNTFYLKNGSDWSQGWRYFMDTAGTYPLVLGCALLLVAAVELRRRGHAMQWAPRLWMLVLALPVLLYVAKIGGDHRHYRYLAFPMVLIAAATGGIPERLLALATPARRRLWATAATLVLLLPTALAFPRQLSRHPCLGRGEHRLVDKIEDAAVHRYHKDLYVNPLGSGRRFELKDNYRALGAERPAARYRGILMSYWCVDFYKECDRRAVHKLGLTEPILAHVDMPSDRPAHKLGLMPLGVELGQLLTVQRVAGALHPSFFALAAQAGAAPPWIARNLGSITLIEFKACNRHHPLENLKLALTRVPRLHVGPGDSPRAELEAAAAAARGNRERLSWTNPSESTSATTFGASDSTDSSGASR